jgi:hypothetical protein
LVDALKETSGERVVILIDEYDAPIQDALAESLLLEKQKTYLPESIA